MRLDTQSDVVRFLHDNSILFARPELAKRRDIIQKGACWLVVPEEQNWGSETLIVAIDGSVVRAVPKG